MKANVLFFDRKPGREEPWTRRLRVYDLRAATAQFEEIALELEAAPGPA